MPGPKMGPRPPDFNEELVRRAPTFKNWEKLAKGERMMYACREFIKGEGDDEERLMRRIMIARRNNLKDHAVIKQMRAAEASSRGVDVSELKKRRKVKREMTKTEQEELGQLPPLPPSNPSGTKPRRVAGTIQPTDQEILQEMDVPAVEATRSYKKWLALQDGEKFVYNQTYEKGKKDHDWLLRKNIWRRMRYRRENKAKVERMRQAESGEVVTAAVTGPTSPQMNFKSAGDTASSGQEETKMAGNKATGENDDVYVAAAAAAAAVAVADSLAPPDISAIDADAVAALVDPQALDAAAQLAATIDDPVEHIQV
mmetsp:Transcript_9277/g.13333  ORF Transcript_9277/g.13333 Transcript_9277/m.13333 type:complete len:313 (+) Transcript_9277:116-1054(+)|eukprot:CAMPEP_0201694662 /NCGR_PEP_ID=MMETSP0578-20130828/6845_1 /ASSEMBLY_ACC=CAM_ASM_000663 /TAXON_ID=267565 /ORGANISM="Skeletonema grethea, Strain CCMP 1804" /LENGTH=312 /DNA_ID=CAMNT_0048180367 /DNA_START=94 /DNA_END=1032 /DNA_ORIENTATION=-